MLQLTQNYKDGTLALLNAPSSRAGRHGIVVRNGFSLISSGTETMKVREGSKNLLGKAWARPDQMQQVLESVQQVGLLATYRKVMNRLDRLTPLGYSSAGVVWEAGDGCNDVTIGDRVACAGAEYAHHAEFISIAKNLYVRVPDQVTLREAAFATVGAIALHAMRQGDVRLGETVAVIGLGLIGQLLTQILVSAGCQVIGIDLVPERCRLAERLGASGAATEEARLIDLTEKATGGRGADCIFLAAGGLSSKSVALAAAIARDRGRVINVGMNQLEIPWKAYYAKELQVHYSRSYGPGRYDRNYEELGQDYPVGYVRWTERRNMEAFLHLLASGRVNVEPLITGTYPFADAEKAYQAMVEAPGRHLAVLFEYPQDERQPDRSITLRNAAVQGMNVVKLGCIGAGNYARGTLLPLLKKRKDVDFAAVATQTSLSALDSARRFGFAKASTDYHEVLDDPAISAVVIATRHDSHAQLSIDCLRAGKHVFVEKPLAVNVAELEAVTAALKEANTGLQVGFNRRFAPMVTQLKALLQDAPKPLTINYRIHAGKLSADTWYLNPEQGGRFIGEGGHFLDLMVFLTGAPPKSVFARAVGHGKGEQEELACMISFLDGSIGTLTYVASGNSRTPKEYVEVLGGGVTGVIDNFQHGYVLKNRRRYRLGGRNDKGQAGELAAFLKMVVDGGLPPIPYDQLLAATQATIAVRESIEARKEIHLNDLTSSSNSGGTHNVAEYSGLNDKANHNPPQSI